MKPKINEIDIFIDHAEVILTDRAGREKGRAIISLDKIDVIKGIRWCLYNTRGKSYAIHEGVHGKLWLHRYIINAPSDLFVDVIDGNHLNLLNNNLRVCTNMQNNWNKDKYCTNTSGHRGVTWIKNRDKWLAQIFVNGKNKSLGYRDTIEDAIQLRLEAEIKFFGEYAYKDDK